jgi:hypothetical protein
MANNAELKPKVGSDPDFSNASGVPEEDGALL